MNILVTGGAGYVGSILVPALLKLRHRVTVIDNFMYRQTSLLDCCNDPGLTIVRGDVRNDVLMKEQLQGIDFIIPLASLVGAPICHQNPVGAKTTNHDALRRLLQMREPGQKIIFPTTNSGYGVGEKGIYCTEETRLRPISHYAKLKVEIEKAILDSGESITLRLATVFGIGPRMRKDLLVNDFVYRALYDSAIILFEAHFKRNYIHIQDVAASFLHCVDNFEAMKGRPYNVGLNDANLSKWELCEVIKKIIPRFTFIEAKTGEDPDRRNYIVSNERINAAGFCARISLEEGIRELIKGYQVIKENMYSNV